MNIIVTGASRGIGYALAGIFSQDPQNKVIGIAREKAGLMKLRQPGRKNLHILPFDLLLGDYINELIPEVITFTSEIDILVNNAGMLINKPFDLLKDEDFDMMFDSNVKSAFRLIHALLPYFAERSHIVNIGSMGGLQGSIKFPGLSLYSASKGALAILTECLAEELKEKKISVNCLALGSAQTEMLSAAFPGYKAPLSAKEMAGFIAYFSLHGHHYFNGKILPVSMATP